MSFLFTYLFSKSSIDNNIINENDYILITKNEFNELNGYSAIFSKIKCIFEEKKCRQFLLNNYINLEEQDNEQECKNNKEDNKEDINSDIESDTDTNVSENEDIQENNDNTDTIETISSKDLENEDEIENKNEQTKDKDKETYEDTNSNILKLQTENKIKILRKDYDILLDRQKFIKRILNMDNIYNFIMYEHDNENENQIINKDIEHIEYSEELTISYFENHINNLRNEVSILNEKVANTNKNINMTLFALVSFMSYIFINLN